MKKNGGLAFPRARKHATTDNGMSLRDYFAAKAMQGILTSDSYRRHNVEFVANFAYEIADAMLKKRENNDDLEDFV